MTAIAKKSSLHVVDPTKPPVHPDQKALDYATLLAQIQHDCRDVGLVCQILFAKPELRGRSALVRGIGVQLDGFVFRLNKLRRVLLPLVVGAVLLSGCTSGLTAMSIDGQPYAVRGWLAQSDRDPEAPLVLCVPPAHGQVADCFLMGGARRVPILPGTPARGRPVESPHPR